MTRFAARAAALLALLVGWSFAAGDRLTVPFLAEAQAAAGSSFDDDSHDLTALRVFNRVVLLVKENYFDPRRIEPKQMMVDSLDYLEKQVPEVMVDGDAKTGVLQVVVGSKRQSFPIRDVDSIFKMSLRLGQVMGFVQKNLAGDKSAEELREVEYALVNGMLTSLDPHSVLLKPSYFKEMKLSTKGEFGGLGFVISMKEGQLTVMKVLKGTKENPTPALKAGIKANDQILRIGEESTVNMDLNDAVERLRGKPGSKVTIRLRRKAWKESRPITLARAKIEIESVESELLSNKVGYIRIKNFQGNTARDLQLGIRALKEQAGDKLAGLVLDLRGNPGGLLEQAIQVSDVFLDEGTIVTTVGMSDKLREVKRARAGDTERDLPVAVLVNNGSASASEIVAGALKNLDRAVVLGRTTFGKGSVQVLYDFPDDSALKLTIAQYLTPGDVSIQETGIVPDIELVAAKVEKDEINAFAPPRVMREMDLEGHLSNPARVALGPDPTGVAAKEEADKRVEKASHSLRYLRDEKPKGVEGDPDADEEEELPDEFVEDFQIRFARDLLLTAPYPSRSKMLPAIEGFLAKRSVAEQQRIEQAIAALGIDWRAKDAAANPASVSAPRIIATLAPGPKVATKAGETLPLTVEVENLGATPLYQLRAWTESEGNPFLDRREFLFGMLAPGQKKRWTAPVELPQELASRRDLVKIRFEDASGKTVGESEGEVNLVELPKPRFAFNWQVIDATGDGDGLPDPGEQIQLRIDVRNVGEGPTSDVTFASIKNKGNEKVFIEKGRFKIAELKPGKTVATTFELELKKGYREATIPLQVLIFDEKLEELVTERLEIAVDQSGRSAVKATGFVQIGAPQKVLAAPHEELPVLATAPKGSVLKVQARVGDFARVEWGKGRTGFVALPAKEKLAQRGRANFAGVTPEMWRSAPKIVLDVDTSAGGVAVNADRYKLTGSVEDARLRDLYVFVNDQKVFFTTAGKADGPVRFNADFPLKEGSNHVVVVAREGEELASRRAFTVLRREAAVAEKLSPKPPTRRVP